MVKISKKKIKKILINKYFLISFSFIIWICFFDTNSLILHYKFKITIDKMMLYRNFIKKKILHEKKIVKKLSTDLKFIEKYAREKFYMKKEDEDLFVYKDDKEISSINM
ncbi:septum formation initiator family protein [Blattabacterium cuenoti]|uniref:septum formation initiator family protein n=1 Tax=Blattabacterium cuenoti TaxID=1653831 RepID=UPI00163C75F7|nr:septum formation initiator family protein [Blattabacterium cuenoti]